METGVKKYLLPIYWVNGSLPLDELFLDFVQSQLAHTIQKEFFLVSFDRYGLHLTPCEIQRWIIYPSFERNRAALCIKLELKTDEISNSTVLSKLRQGRDTANPSTSTNIRLQKFMLHSKDQEWFIDAHVKQNEVTSQAIGQGSSVTRHWRSLNMGQLWKLFSSLLQLFVPSFSKSRWITHLQISHETKPTIDLLLDTNNKLFICCILP